MSVPLSHPEPAREVDARPDLDRSLLRGIAWTAGIRWLAQILTWAVTLVVARLLTPADYGLMGMATVYFGLLMMVSEFGLGTSIVILRTLPRQRISELNTLAALIGVAGFGLSCLLADPVARFYGAPEVRGIILWLSGAFVVTAFRTVPYGLLQKDLRFKHLALIQGIPTVTAALGTLALAYLGYGYWALVGGSLVHATVSAVLALAARPHPFALPRTGLGTALRISSHLLTGRLAWYFYSNADFLIAGKVLGKTALGFYSFALTLASIPIDRITAMVSKVTPAFFSAVQDDPAALRRYFLNLTEGLALLTLPAAWGLSLVADDFVLLALGEKWRGAVAPLRILAFYAAFRCIAPLLSPVLNVTGQTQFTMRIGVLSAIVLPIGFLVGSRFGTVGIALAWLLLDPLVKSIAYWRVFRTLDMRVQAYLRALWPALSASLLMVVVVGSLKWSLPEQWSLAGRFAGEVLAGLATYGIALVVLHPSRVRAARDLMRTLRD